MYQHILVATGGSPWSDAAVSYATAIAARTGATLHIVTVLINPAMYTTMEVMGGSEIVTEVIEREGQALLDRAAEQARQVGVNCKTEHRWGSIPETILHTAEDVECDLIVLGARMVTGWKRLRLGHIANAVAVKAQQPVLVVKQPPGVVPGSPLGRHLLVATGGSPWSDMAVDYAIVLAQTERLTLSFLHVVPRRRRRDRDLDDIEGRQILARAETRAIDAGVTTTTTLTHGDVTKSIVETADKQSCDAIVLGSRGASGWKRLMLGDIANAVIVSTALPVLVVKGSTAM